MVKRKFLLLEVDTRLSHRDLKQALKGVLYIRNEHGSMLDLRVHQVQVDMFKDKK